uniref:Odorant receptor n=1 Tax=Haemonchus contortus TaxID=6289 RepID=A0A7I4XSQ3_HAECO
VMSRVLFSSITAALILSQIIFVEACLFTNYTANSAYVKRLGDFFTTETIYICMWHCYVTKACVMMRYRALNKMCLLFQHSDVLKEFGSRVDHTKILTIFKLDRELVEPSCSLVRLTNSTK